MEETLTLTRTDLVEAFRHWHADCEKHPEGGFKGVAPDNPEQQADTLLGYLMAMI